MREKKYATQTENISKYITNLLGFEKDIELNAALDIAKKRGTPPLQVTPADGRHIEVLARLLQPKKIVEIGTLCGYSTICLARAISGDGRVYTCERSEHHAKVAKEVFANLGYNSKIEIIFGEALAMLPTLNEYGPFDIVFIDANKDQYPEYFDWAIENLRVGGMLIADNVFVFGNIANESFQNEKLNELVEKMRIFNEKCANHSSLLSTFLPTGEGLMVAVKR